MSPKVSVLRIVLAAVVLLAAAGARAAPIRAVRVEKANVRAGPGPHEEVVDTVWRYTPFEVLGREGQWVHVRDFEDYEGWIHGALLAAMPAVVVKVEAANVRSGPGLGQESVWVVEAGYPFKVVERDGKWLKIDDGEEIQGWIHQSVVWGRTSLGG